jgi:hypothetical protein
MYFPLALLLLQGRETRPSRLYSERFAKHSNINVEANRVAQCASPQPINHFDQYK